MNRFHHWYCRTAHWEKAVQARLAWALADVDLGQRVLELGPGPGLTTNHLRRSVSHLTALELDRELADALRVRLDSSNVEVVTGDATAIPFSNDCFSSCVSFAMLHHVPSPALQDQVLREVHRVLKPGASFIGTDTRESFLMHMIHLGDRFVPVDPDTFETRLTAAGFRVLELEKNSRAFRFHARRQF